MKYTKLFLIFSTIILAIISEKNYIQASDPYKIHTVKEYPSINEKLNPEIAYYPKKTKKTIWAYNINYYNSPDYKFTKHSFNLSKHYKRNFFIESKIKVYHKGTIKYYYEITNRSRSLQGYVPVNSLKKGINPLDYQLTDINRKYHDFYHAKKSKKPIHLWNSTLSKKILNLNDYPSMNWNVTFKGTFQKQHKKYYYYHVTNRINNDMSKKEVSGYIKTSNMIKGLNPNHDHRYFVNLAEFINNTDFNRYLNTNKNQKLAREIMKLFPNSKPDLRLSKIAARNYDSYFDMDGDSDPISEKGYHDIINFQTIKDKLEKNKSASLNTKINIVKKGLAKQGYTKKKRESMKNYRLGLQIINNLNSNIIGDDGDGGAMNNCYVFILAKKD